MKKTLALVLLLAFFIPLVSCQQANREARDYYLVEDFEGEAIGILENSGLEASLTDRISGVKVKTFASADEAVKALKAHKIEAIALHGGIADYLINSDETLGKIIEVYTENPIVAASLTIGDTAEGEFRADIDATLSKIKGDGSYYTFLEKYIINEAPTGADSRIEFYQSTFDRELNIGVCENAPFAYKNDSGEWTGFDIEIANAIARQYRATPIFKEYERNDLIEAVHANEVRVAFGQFTEKESEDWEAPVYPSTYYDNSVYFVVNEIDVGFNPFEAQ